MEQIKRYYIYGITYYNTKGEILCKDYYLNKEERDLIFEQGDTSKVYPNVFPAEKKAMFHTWRMPLGKFEKKKKALPSRRTDNPYRNKGRRLQNKRNNRN